MTDAANPSGLTDEEAQEFHQYYIQGYLLWAAGALFAHSLVVLHPGLPVVGGWRSLRPQLGVDLASLVLND